MLELINEPNDVRKIPEWRLYALANEIRQLIIKTVSKTGGHLASNLGTVELTIALHRVCNLPYDKIIWDVGHQSYTHKILTGRKDRLDTLRKEGGLSGFCRIEESDCDSFSSGHSSTSISAGVGYVRARELSGEHYKVISVLGDGALTGGMVFESINNADSLMTKFMIVLNDNNMSISPNIGGMADYLSNLRTSARYNALKTSVANVLENIPVVGDDIVKSIRSTKSSIKQLFIPGMMFEEMGITYLGPINGHNIMQMIRTFNEALRFEGPVIVHTVTEKGRGYKPACSDPEKFHGISAFDIKSGCIFDKKKETYTKIFADTLCDIAKDNKKVVAVTAAMKEGTGLAEFEKLFPDRLFDVGIAEQHAVTFSAGLALGGFIPVAAIYSSFLQRAFDQIMTDICIQNAHVILAIDRAGFVGEDGKTHQGLFDLSYLTMLPNMTIMAPKDGGELEAMLRFAVKLEGPVAIRYGRGEAASLGGVEKKELEYGKGEVLKKGSCVAVLAIGAAVETALKAADMLSEKGTDVTVVNMRFVKPIDTELIASLAKEHDIFLTVEENVRSGGFGEQVLNAVNELDLNTHVVICSAGDEFVAQGSIKEQRQRLGLDELSLKKEILRLLKERQ